MLHFAAQYQFQKRWVKSFDKITQTNEANNFNAQKLAN